MGRRVRDTEWRTTRAEVVEAIRTGRITGREVMEELGISSALLGGWCRAEQVRRDGAVKAAGPVVPPRFAEVRLVGDRPIAARAIVVLRGGRRLRVAPGFDADEVVRLVRALESC
ncbi:MAG TPA: hypothetical protein VFY23_13905 [Candidatus Limnocylindrales bacterium]|nr:hypothetical protein [Candidatus Limnocylindrales bacterium]